MKSYILLLAATLPALSQQHWVATWGTAQQQYRTAGRGGPVPTAGRGTQPSPLPPGRPGTTLSRTAPSSRAQTIRPFAWSSALVSATWIARPPDECARRDCALPRRGARRDPRQGQRDRPGLRPRPDVQRKPTATIYAGQMLVSDSVTLDVPPLTDPRCQPLLSK